MGLRLAVPVCVLSVMACSGSGLGAARTAPPGRLIPVAGAQSVSFGAGQIWVTTLRGLVRIDPARGTVVARVRFRNLVVSAAVDGQVVWVLTRPIVTGSENAWPSLLYSVDIASDRVVGAPIRLFPMAQGQMLVAGGSLWITNDNHGRFGRLFRIDPRSRTVAAAVRIPEDPRSIVYADGLLWVGESDAGTVVRVDPSTGAIQGRPIVVGRALLALAADHGKVWVASAFSGRLAAIDASTARVISDWPLARLGGIAASRGKVWTILLGSGEVRAFDAATGRRTLTSSKIRGGADGIATSGRSVWVISSLGITPLASLRHHPLGATRTIVAGARITGEHDPRGGVSDELVVDLGVGDRARRPREAPGGAQQAASRVRRPRPRRYLRPRQDQRYHGRDAAVRVARSAHGRRS